MYARIGRPSPAMVVAIIALIVSLGGTAVAAHRLILPKNSIGTRQLKSKAVTTGKINNNAVTSVKVRNHTLTGGDINISTLPSVPAADRASSAANSDKVNGYSAGCPAGTQLIRGYCFDAASNPPVEGVLAASDGCASKGGFLPTPMMLRSVRGILNLGQGVGTDRQFTDVLYANTSTFDDYSTIVMDGNGNAVQVAAYTTDAEYICVYPLVHG